jgi:isoleucyl-tRNA synthetase
VALAIGEDINYAVVKKADEYYILAKDRLSILEDYKVLGEISGKALIGLSYEPLFAGAVNRGNSQTAWTVLPAGFVTTADGTGVVHTAVMYGEEDYQLGKTAGLPTQHTVDQTGRFLPSVKKWAGQFVKAKDVEAGIIQDLQDRGLLLKLENYTHEYPFCWRCETPLLYYAKDSWFIRMSSLRSELLANNQNINWVPAYLKTGRFGEWLKEVKDWAISRERYWGTPLPIWVCEKCKAVKVVGSFKDLQEARGSKAEKRSAQILIMRHGVSTKNFPSIVQSRIEDNHKHILTKEGKKNVKETAEKLKGEIDIIISSDFQRTRETAEIVSQITGAKIVYDRDLREIYEPDYEGRPVKEVQAELESQLKTKYPPLDLNLGGGENYYQVKTRMQRAVQNAIRNFTNKRILIVSHGDPLWILKWSYSGLPEENYFETPYPKKGEFEELTVPIQFDPHRPFVDEIKLTCEKCSGEMRRVPEVLDVWFDSGAMPFAQWHYPFENADRIDKHKNFPADYISEGIDQTRGWFYTLLAISTLLGKGAPFKNVISLGLILDKSGQKMSKSKGNVVEPKAVIDEFGADALRLHLFAMSQPGEPKLFDLKGVEETVKKTILIFWNIFIFYQTYVAEAKPAARDLQPENLMDKWILARLAQATQSVTAKMEAFDPTSAVRELQNFITELSTWYLRRSREKLRPGENFDPITASVLKSVLQKTCVLLAPFAPFLAEKIYQEIKETSAEMSVHLAAWPTDFSFNEKSLSEMAVVRRAVEKGHALRRLLDIKVRQPLLMALVSTKLSLEYEKIIAEELNVETVRSGEQEIAKAGADVQWSEETDNTGLKVGLTKEITEELRHKGLVREMARQVNDLRKAAGLTIKDLVEIEWQTADETLNHVFTEHAPVLRDLTRCRSIKKGRVEEVDFKKDLIIGKARVLIGVKR